MLKNWASDPMAWDPGTNVTIFACPCEWVPESAFVWVPELVPVTQCRSNWSSSSVMRRASSSMTACWRVTRMFASSSNCVAISNSVRATGAAELAVAAVAFATTVAAAELAAVAVWSTGAAAFAQPTTRGCGPGGEVGSGDRLRSRSMG